jgi:hypothetical protein
VEHTEAIWRDGWADLYEEFGMKGVYFTTQPLDTNDGSDGDVILCLDVPDEVFKQFDATSESQQASGYRMALIPADALNRIGKPQVYDHTYAGLSRRGMLEVIRFLEFTSH